MFTPISRALAVHLKALAFGYEGAAYRAGLAGFRDIVAKAVGVGRTRFVTWVFADHNCLSGLEFIGPKSCRAGRKHSFVHTTEQMIDLAAAAGPNVGLPLDSGHRHASVGTIVGILDLRSDQLVRVHLTDAPRGLPVEM